VLLPFEIYHRKWHFYKRYYFFLVIVIFSGIIDNSKLPMLEDMATDSKTKSLVCLKAAIEKKAVDPILLELKEIASFTDYFLLLSGKSDRQVQAIAQAIEEALKKKGVRPLGQEGMLGGKWVLMDYEDVVVHIFLEPMRRFYDLEGLWVDAPRIDLQKDKEW
jgi:ribosome-associated protein